MGAKKESTIIGEDYKQAGYCKVTFYYNGGLSSGSSSIEYFITNGGRLPLPGTISENATIINPTKSGYQFYGWFAVKPEAFDEREEYMYEPTLDEDAEKIPIYNTKGEHATRKVPYLKRGEQIFDEKNLISLKEYEEEQEPNYAGEKIFIKEWSFDFDKVTDDIILVAIWQPQRYFIIIPPENKNDDFNAEEYESKFIFNVNANGSITLPSSTQLPRKEGWQIEGYYLDRACTIKVPFDSRNRYYPEIEYDEETGRFKILPIYIKWLDAKFRIVTAANALANMSETGNYYIANDLDFSNVTNFRPPAVFRGEIRGNNYTWRNLNITIDQEKFDDIFNNSNYGGLFGELIGARIRDIIIENVNITFVRINPEIPGNDPSFWSLQVNFHLFAKSIDTRSVIRNVTVGLENSLQPSTFSVVEFSRFRTMQRVVLDENGYPYRWTEPTEQGQYRIAADENGNYPEEGSIYYPKNDDSEVSIVIKYQRNYDGEFIYYTEAATDPLDGRVLYGNMLYSAPSYTPPLKVWQNAENFGLEATDSIKDCQVNITEVQTEIPWQVILYPGDNIPRLLPYTDYTTGNYEWAGWYTEDYKRVDSTTTIDQPTKIIAMWKRQIT